MSDKDLNTFGARSTLKVGGREYVYYRLNALKQAGLKDVSRLPITLKVVLENLLRCEDGKTVTAEQIKNVVRAIQNKTQAPEIAFRPARVILQDFTGVPAVVDLAAMREALRDLGGDPDKINPEQPVDLVIDHSVQVDRYGTPDALKLNTEIEMRRNGERYTFLRWGQKAFKRFRVVPPGTGIVHQVNLEHLASVVFTQEKKGQARAYPDTLVGTDSHTTMINGLGILGWGVGGIEAEAAMLGQPITMLVPKVVGFKLTGRLPAAATATDLVLTVTEILRKKGVVGKYVEFFGPGVASLSLPDRATLSNMCPEYGATVGFFPVDEKTIEYLELTGREKAQINLVQAYTKAQGLFVTGEAPEPEFSETVEFNLESVEPSLAGPRRPQDRIALSKVKRSFNTSLRQAPGGGKRHPGALAHGSVVIAAITSCTNTSNPSVMIGAGLLAKKAVEKGLTIRPWVKTSLAPGSLVVMDYLKKTGLIKYLETLQFHLVGFGCTTCIGNSGPLSEDIQKAVKEGGLVTAAVLSGNRNFEGRVNPLVRFAYLASPPLVVAYAIAGSMDIDLTQEPIGKNKDGKDIYLKEIWPTSQEVEAALKSVDSGMFRKSYASVFEGDAAWQAIRVSSDKTYSWDPESTYVKRPPFLEGIGAQPVPVKDIEGARVLALLGHSVTTDHISPAGAISPQTPAGQYLIEQGVDPKDFNSFGARRGNHEVMMRGTFGNIRLRNLLAPGTEGGWTAHQPSGEKMWIYEASRRYRKGGIGLIVLAGKEYGSGSSRDWAAKGPALLGVRAVIAESYERIHRSNLIGMGILPLQFKEGQSAQSLQLTGREAFSIGPLAAGLKPGQSLTVTAEGDGKKQTFEVLSRIDTPQEIVYYQHGGILPYVLRQLAGIS